jgi:hypothetical protein
MVHKSGLSEIKTEFMDYYHYPCIGTTNDGSLFTEDHAHGRFKDRPWFVGELRKCGEVGLINKNMVHISSELAWVELHQSPFFVHGNPAYLILQD